MAFQMMV